MATGDGNSYHHIVKKHEHKLTDPTYTEVYRQIFWARYVDWLLTTPLLLLDLSFLAGLNGADIIVAVVADMIMIITGLFAAFGQEKGQKWGWYIMAWVAYLVVIYQVAVGGRRNVATKGTATARFFAMIGGFTLILWTLYPVVWAVGDGARKLSVDQEIIGYAVLDVLAKVVFGFWLLLTHARSATAVNIEGWWSHGLNSEGALRLDDDEGA
jgi:bacteriorhodopsin